LLLPVLTRPDVASKAPRIRASVILTDRRKLPLMHINPLSGQQPGVENQIAKRQTVNAKKHQADLELIAI